jgi:hypothetical protein
MAKMKDDALRAMLKARKESAVNRLDSEYSKNRREALAFYRGDPHSAYGEDEPGMSKIISRDTMEAIESMMPQLLKPFVSGDEVVCFEPTGPEDEESAKQATEYINYLFNKKNDGFSIITEAVKDGLLFRAGVAKVVMEEDTDYTTERYDGLSQIEVEAIKSGENIEITAQDPSKTVEGAFDVEISKARKVKRVNVYAVAPDEFLFERHLARLKDATFLGQQTRRTVGDLVAMGLDKDKCLRLTDEDNPGTNTERTQRFLGESASQLPNDDDMSRVVQVSECYLKCDYNGDGKLVWRKIIIGGASDEILLNEAADGHPFVCWTPIPIPHKLIGMSIHDLTRELQLGKTAMMREAFNNLYLSNRPMREIVEGQVNIDDVLNPRVGGVVRVKAPGMSREVATTFTAGASFQMIEYIDSVREQRTGSTRYNQGMDANSLNKTATGISSIMSAASQRMEMIARQFAEQFLKPLFGKMLELVCKNPDQKEVIRLRNQWVEMDPREWKTNYDMTVTVGLGTGNREKMVGELNMLLQMDEKIIQLQGGAAGPLVTMDNIYEKLKRLVEAMGLKGIENYYTDPQEAQQAPQEGKPDPMAIKAQGEAQVKIETAHINAAADIEIARINARKDLMIANMKAPAEMLAAMPAPEGPGPDEGMMHEQVEAPQFEQMEPMLEGEPGGY